MKISQNSVVELIYTLFVDGNIADQTTEERPLDFIFGTGNLLPKFEENISGKEANEEFDFKLTASEGYGEVTKEAHIELPKNVFETDGQIQEGLLTIGNTIPMMNSMGGVVPGKVLEVKEETVVMDFNHPMAGKDLHFTGKILSVRAATEEELKNGLHGELAGSSCGSECSSCSGGCN